MLSHTGGLGLWRDNEQMYCGGGPIRASDAGASGFALKGKGWRGIKTDWLVSPSYSGWVVVRAEQLGSWSPVPAERPVSDRHHPDGSNANHRSGTRGPGAPGMGRGLRGL